MLIAQLIRPEELLSLDERQFEVLQATLLSEMISNPEIRRLLDGRAKETLTAIKKVQRSAALPETQ